MHKFVGDYIYYIYEHGPEPGAGGLTATERHIIISIVNRTTHGHPFTFTVFNRMSCLMDFVSMNFSLYVDSVYRELVESEVNGNAEQAYSEVLNRFAFISAMPIRINDVAREGDVI